ncbi:HTTM domain-containing protein [Peribacillus simplex]|uniref:HTTM domain-containing protein n=1 Tax=Peribacillus simplex TaxID=1478 RepID=A0AAW7IH20_9BACI|nr:HTTM domain-containing protein [Peribacillus simplex]MDM5450881.1 HTTM domain-containing protein [Peribacillus simplex]
MLDKIIRFVSIKRSLIGASILRVGFGIIILYTYAINYSQRRFLWGPDGLTNTDYSQQTKPLTLYSFSNSTMYFELIFHLGIVITMLFILGYMTRIMTILNYIFLYSIYHQNGSILDGGYNLMLIISVYLILVKSNEYLSIDKHLKKSKKDNIYINIIHNIGILSIIVQLCILYLNSSLYKVMGEPWQNGTALYYILQVKEFNLPWISNLILSSDILIVFGTYFTVMLQVAFPFLLFNKITKYIALLLIVPMHLGIAFVMGLISFSLTMVLIDTVLISDNDYKKIYTFCKRKMLKFRKRNEVAEPIPKSM